MSIQDLTTLRLGEILQAACNGHGLPAEITMADALAEIIRLRGLADGVITVHLLASDVNDSGTAAALHFTQKELLLSKLALCVSEEGDPDEYERIKELIDNDESDEADDAMEDYRDPSDTFATETVEIDLVKLRQVQAAEAERLQKKDDYM